MAKKCPVKSDKGWIDLMDKYKDESLVFLIYDQNNEEIPTLEEAEKIVEKLKSEGNWITDSKLRLFVLDAIDNFMETTHSMNELMFKIKKYIRSQFELSEEELQTYYDKAREIVFGHTEEIKKLRSVLDIMNGAVESLEAAGINSDQKIDAHRKVFSTIFKRAAKIDGLDKTELEEAFFNIVSEGFFDGISTELEYAKKMVEFNEKYPQYKALSDEIIAYYPYNRAVSLFNFYRSVRIIEQVGLIIDAKGPSFKIMNEKKHGRELEKTFMKHLESKKEDPKYFDKIQENFESFYVSSFSKKNITRLDVYKRSLQYLSDMTGIPAETWREYMSPKTNETKVMIALESKDGSRNYDDVVFDNFESLLNFNHEQFNNTYDPKNPTANHKQFGIVSRSNPKTPFADSISLKMNKGVLVPKTIPTITQVLYSILKNNKDDRQKTVNKYFMVGSAKVKSNLQQLASAMTKNNGVSLKGIDIKGDKFNSFRLYSDLQNKADHITSLNIDNELVQMYKKRGESMKISLINGLKSNTTNRAVTSDKVSETEYWLIQMALFNNNQQGSYKGILGQFGDKGDIPIADMKYYAEGNESDIKKEFNNYDSTIDFLNKISKAAVRFGILQNMDSEEREFFVRQFAYNYAKNMKDVIQIFHGELDSYVDKKGKFSMEDLVKRGSSTISTGYQLDENVKGGIGSSIRMIIAEDMVYPDELGLDAEAFNGALFFSGEMAKKTAISQGSSYSKIGQKDENGKEITELTSVKALISFVRNGKRGLTKGNWYNIDVIAEAYKDQPNSIYHKIKKIIDENKIDLLSFTSSSKKPGEAKVLKLFNGEELNEINKATFESHIINEKTSNVYVQQDLRHDSTAKRKKMAIQLFTNIMSLNAAPEIFNLIDKSVTKEMEVLTSKLAAINTQDQKIKFILEQMSEDAQPELYSLIEKGLTIHDPGTKNLMQSMLASYITNKVLGMNTKRTVTQELPADKTLKGLRPTEDKKHTLLPEIDVSIEGIRYRDDRFKGNQKEALKQVKKQHALNQNKYKDLFDKNGELKYWEIENGIIPGEYVLSTRTPAGGLNCHTCSRARYKLNGNFTVLDKESQARAGSDYDGDFRFNSVMYQEHDHMSVQDINTNKILRLVAEEYEDPKNFDRIRMPVDTKYFDTVVNKFKKSSDEYLSADPVGLNDLRKKNTVGTSMKGILTNLLTSVSVISSHGFALKDSVGIGSVSGNKFVKDKHGKMRNGLNNLLNMAYDNAKNPKIEIMGLNEQTANMFVMLMFVDNSFDNIQVNKQDDYIIKKADKIATYFNNTLLQDFIERKRYASGSIAEVKDSSIFKELLENYDESEVKELKKLYYNSIDLQSVQRYYSLTEEVPQSSAELAESAQLNGKIINNKLSVIDLGQKKEIVSELNVFKNISPILNFLRNKVFDHTIDQSEGGRYIYNRFLQEKRKSNKEKYKRFSTDTIGLTTKELESISMGLNQYLHTESVIAKLRSMNFVPPRFKDLEKSLHSGMATTFKERYPGNKFLMALQIKDTAGEGIKISDGISFSQMKDADLKEIQEDFNKLEKTLQHQFVLYMFQKFGSGTSNFTGSYHQLLSDEYRVELSQMVQFETERWHVGGVSKLKMDHVFNWINYIQNINESLGNKINSTDSRVYDLMSDYGLNISNDALEEIAEMKFSEGATAEEKFNQLKKILNTDDIDYDSFEKVYIKEREKNKEEGKKYTFVQFAKDLLADNSGYKTIVNPKDLFNLADDYKPCIIP